MLLAQKASDSSAGNFARPEQHQQKGGWDAAKYQQTITFSLSFFNPLATKVVSPAFTFIIEQINISFPLLSGCHNPI